MNHNPNCLFCKIASKQIAAPILYEDDHVIAFLDIMPRTPGHTLVVSKDHAPTLIQLPPNEVGPLFAAVKKVTALLVEKLGSDGATIGINQGRVAGQEVDHLHVHVMPRWTGDGGGSIQSIVNVGNKGMSVEDIKKKVLG